MQPQNSSQNPTFAALLQQSLQHLNNWNPEIPEKKVYKYPYLDKEAINATIQNGKRFAQEFNKAQAEKSKGINKINYELRVALKKDPHTSKQKVLFQEFKQQNKLATKAPMAYNQKVLEFNRQHGTHFLLRTYRELKNEIHVTLPVLIRFYTAQIRQINANKLNAGVTTMGTLPRMLTNSENIKRYKVEEVPQIKYQNDAILNHVHNLVEAGILINYKSHGRNMGFSCDFNPDILAIKDHDPAKNQNAEKQPLIKFKTGKPTYSDCITGSYKNESEIKGDAVGIPDERNGAEAPTAANREQNRVTKSEENPAEKANSEPGKSGKNQLSSDEKQEQVKPGRGEDHPSVELESKIQDQWELCQELEANKHVHHIPVDPKKLEWEARKGIMSQQRFRELLFQEFMKSISRLKRDKQSAAGAFYRAFEELEDQKLKNFAGRYFTKTAMLAEFEKWLWMVDHAERWAKKRDWQFLFINDYLDTQRRDAREMGFWYLEKIWKQNEKKKESRRNRRAKKQQAHKIRKEKIKRERVEEYGYRSVKPGTNSRSLSDYEKARQKVRKYLFGEITFEELHRYCSDNLNKTIVDGLRNLIDSEAANLNRYKA